MNSRTMHCQTSYEVLLMEYAAGSLDLAQRLVISAHLAMSPEARKHVKDCERVGAALMEKSCEPVAMSKGSLESVMRKIEACETPQQQPQHRHRHFPEDALIPNCIEEFIVCGPRNTLRWKTIYPGMDSFALPLECRRSHAHVFRFGPGMGAPRHRHGGLELTLILGGAFADENDIYKQGSLIVMDTDSAAHTPKACDTHGCVCITVLAGDIRPTNPFVRLFSPFFRF
jgi:putative transcriptional regulator